MIDPNTLRPGTLAEFAGQEALMARLMPVVEETSAELDAYTETDFEAGESVPRLPHILLTGEPGLGKTTLANLIAQDLDVGFHRLDLSQLTPAQMNCLTHMQGIVLMDEIHRAKPAAQECLLEMLAEGRITGKYGSTLNVEDVTVIGATTSPRDLLPAFRARFRITLELQPYPPEVISVMMASMATKLNMVIPDDILTGLALAALGVPRAAKDFVLAYRTLQRRGPPSLERLLSFVNREYDGLTEAHLRYLNALQDFGIMGEQRLAAVLRLHPRYIQELEDALINRLHYVLPSPQGRVLQDAGTARITESPVYKPRKKRRSA